MTKGNDMKMLQVYSGRRSGAYVKTFQAILKWLLSDKSKGNAQCIYFAPTRERARDIWRRLVEIIPESLIRASNAADLSIETVFGSSVRVVIADD